MNVNTLTGTFGDCTFFFFSKQVRGQIWRWSLFKSSL